MVYTADDGRLGWTDDLVSDQIPLYAILSHTWEEQEVAYNHLQNYKDMEDVDTKLRGVIRKPSSALRKLNAIIRTNFGYHR